MKEYLINFFVWWYVYKMSDYALYIKHRFTFLMIQTRALPMLKYLFTPLYGYDSFTGIIISFFIRITWGFWGLVLCCILVFPFLISFFIAMVLPLLPFYGLVQFAL